MTYDQFRRLVEQGYNYIPVLREILADLDTPLSAYLKLAKGPYSYLLESVQGGEKWGRYSIIGLPAKTVIKITNKRVQVFTHKMLVEEIEVDDPLTWITNFQKRFHVADLSDILPKFTGGLVGYFSYDTVRYIEPHLSKTDLSNPLNTPDILLMVSDEVLVFDNLKGKLYLIVHADTKLPDGLELAEKRLNELTTKLRNENLASTVFEGHSNSKPLQETDFISEFQQPRFEKAVEKIKEYIIEGDVMQVVISQRLSIPCVVPPVNVYRALRCLNPSPYMYYLDLDEFHIVGSSPEILVRLENRELTVRPIAGTRPRGLTEADDIRLEKELLADPKECAEHLMLIDLGRNDVGRVAEIGSVKLTDKMVIERYSHVMHIVSNVTGRLRPEFTALDALRATFPAGTLSGAPKVRAMEIIDELEPSKRGIYGGAVGYVSWSGNMDTAIAIRTAVIQDQTLFIQVGAGVVADSIPQAEWDETMNKGRAMFKAVMMATAGLVVSS